MKASPTAATSPPTQHPTRVFQGIKLGIGLGFPLPLPVPCFTSRLSLASTLEVKGRKQRDRRKVKNHPKAAELPGEGKT